MYIRQVKPNVHYSGVSNHEVYSSEFFCKQEDFYLRLWLDEAFPYEISNKTMFFDFVSVDTGTIFPDNLILETGREGDHHYICGYFPHVTVLDDYYGHFYDQTFYKALQGEFDVQLVFDAKMVKGGQNFLEDRYMIFPSFHDYFVKSWSKVGKKITISLYYMSLDVHTSLQLVLREDIKIDLENLLKGYIQGIDIRRRQDLSVIIEVTEIGEDTYINKKEILICESIEILDYDLYAERLFDD